jgi:hypothetical protein
VTSNNTANASNTGTSNASGKRNNFLKKRVARASLVSIRPAAQAVGAGGGVERTLVVGSGFAGDESDDELSIL